MNRRVLVTVIIAFFAAAMLFLWPSYAPELDDVGPAIPDLNAD